MEDYRTSIGRKSLKMIGSGFGLVAGWSLIIPPPYRVRWPLPKRADEGVLARIFETDDRAARALASRTVAGVGADPARRGA